ncbi:MAG: glycine cleavage system protein H [Chthoniobacter sp.]
MPETSFYKRATFVTHLPADCLYSPSHFWLREIEPGRWRVGFTKFATRMLGEIVEVQWEKASGAPVAAVKSSAPSRASRRSATSTAWPPALSPEATPRSPRISNSSAASPPYAGGWL